ncbi:hypothetical protein Barb7_02225 [Bacteroidales bacterium Barb7]|nr:hypothetical protein Barb7_02225 [Bacteroidales bacterium Barb7]
MLESSDMEVKSLQPLKALLPICSTEIGSSSESNDTQLQKAS